MLNSLMAQRSANDIRCACKTVVVPPRSISQKIMLQSLRGCYSAWVPKILGDAMRRRDFISVIAGMAVSWPIASHAQIYPSRPITMVIPFAAGGAFDVMGRISRPV